MYENDLDEPPFPDPLDDNSDEPSLSIPETTTTCTACGGSGEILTRISGVNPVGYDYDMITCQACRGTGIIHID